jgi:hypothetical protein
LGAEKADDDGFLGHGFLAISLALILVSLQNTHLLKAQLSSQINNLQRGRRAGTAVAIEDAHR